MKLGCALLIVASGISALAAERPRVFITDSKSWEISGGVGGNSDGFGGATRRRTPQTAEIIKTFGERCPTVIVNNKQEMADYIVLLDHEGGKGLVLRDNKVAVFKKSGDALFSHSTRSLGNSVKDACDAIAADWKPSATLTEASADAGATSLVAAPAASAEVEVSSMSLPRRRRGRGRHRQLEPGLPRERRLRRPHRHRHRPPPARWSTRSPPSRPRRIRTRRTTTAPRTPRTPAPRRGSTPATQPASRGRGPQRHRPIGYRSPRASRRHRP